MLLDPNPPVQVVQARRASHLALSQHQPEDLPSVQSQAVQGTFQSEVVEAMANVPLNAKCPFESQGLLQSYTYNLKVMKKRQVQTTSSNIQTNIYPIFR